MLNIGIIIGSTRSQRVSPQVAQHILKHAQGRANVHYEIVDLLDYDLPLYDEPIPAAFSSDYQTPQAKAWSETISRLDGFVFINPEYNRGVIASLKNALDYLYPEFVNKAAGIVGFGSTGGSSAARALREILISLEVAVVKVQPGFNLFTDFKDMREFTPSDVHDGSIHNMFDQLESWGEALKNVRQKA
ncbi:NADPH-dependent FMN reductase [Ectopseudomonas mendocina]|uniref:NADPH-dependent FMN reductase n=1 Tax=Ectopseudomonas mendocina TaxID=300 RepID=A0ABZ2RL13_ECTME